MTKRHTTRSQKARVLQDSSGMPYTQVLRTLDTEQPAEQRLTLGMLVAECATRPSLQDSCGCGEYEGCEECEGGGTGPERYVSALLGGVTVTRYSVLKLAGAVGNRWGANLEEQVVVERLSEGGIVTVRVGGRRFLVSVSQADLLELCGGPGCLFGRPGGLPLCARHLAQEGAEAVLDLAREWAFGQCGVEHRNDQLERYFLRAARMAGIPREQVARVIAEGRNRDPEGPEGMGWDDEAAEARAEIEADVQRLVGMELPEYGHPAVP
ncbi:hypothetical protein [Kitasatospora sp. NPDC047058]|uniref:hypothetical protein n=1 Tax=Kitasatospora sp. NPDC047058 TaxID=3155620 RepID=UPI0033C5875D